MLNIIGHVEQVFTWARQQQFKDIPYEFHQTITHGHGRIDIRRHWLLDGVEHLIKAERWVGLKRGRPGGGRRAYPRSSADD